MNTRPLTLSACLLGLAAPLALSAPAHAKTMQFMAMLDNGQVTPPIKAKNGTGMAMATLNTRTDKLTYTVTWTGLTGPVTMAHFHGPAKPGHNAPVEIVIGNATLTSPVHGSATLTKKEVKDLEDGLLYVNIHTAAYPNGEIRGQVKPTP